MMVFLIQNSQNRDSAAIQVKLDELIRVSAARNSLVGIEHLTDDELEDIRNKCEAGRAPKRPVMKRSIRHGNRHGVPPTGLRGDAHRGKRQTGNARR